LLVLFFSPNFFFIVSSLFSIPPLSFLRFPSSSSPPAVFPAADADTYSLFFPAPAYAAVTSILSRESRRI